MSELLDWCLECMNWSVSGWNSLSLCSNRVFETVCVWKMIHVRVTMIPSERFGDVKLPFGLCR